MSQPSTGSPVNFHPIQYDNGPSYDNTTHAYISIDMAPTATIKYFNLRIINPITEMPEWKVKNLPVPVFDLDHTLFTRINTEGYMEGYTGLMGEYSITSEWIMDSNFPAQHVVDMVPMPLVFNVGSGAADPALDIPFSFPPIEFPPLPPPVIPGLYYRGCEVPNIDLDSSSYYPIDSDAISDFNACGPASAANSLQWLIENDPGLAAYLDEFTLREKLDALKLLMSMTKRDSNGVRFDSMVVGKLTAIDLLELPIRVKYNTKHDSGYPDTPLVSEVEDYRHMADNQGKKGVNPDFDWFKKEMDDGEDVEIHVGWYDPPDADGKRKRNGGHWVVASGYFDGGEAKGIYVKHDTDQGNPGGNKEEFFEWDTLQGGLPYLKNLTDSKGRVGIVESFVSESFDPDIKFENTIDEFNWKISKIKYSDNSMVDDKFHCWLKFTPPGNSEFAYLNAKVCHPDTSKEAWVIRNVPIPNEDFTDPLRVKINLRDIACGDTLPERIIIKYMIGELIGLDTFTPTNMITRELTEEINVLPNGMNNRFHPLFPKLFKLPIFIDNSIEVSYHLRGCEVPNIDLDSMAHPINPQKPNTSDINACAPASIANSLQWLDDQHDEFDIPLDLRGILDSIKKYTNFDEKNGAFWDDMVRGKLELIDRYKLPIHVKFQAHAGAPDHIDSPISKYGHRAENTAQKLNDTTYRHPDFDWLCEELERGEDVEITYGYYCDTLVTVETNEIDSIRTEVLDDGTTIMDTVYKTKDTTYLKKVNAHAINITGKIMVGDMKWITYKHDVYQRGPGGTTEDNTPNSRRFTDMSKWIEVEGGYAYLENELSLRDRGDGMLDTCFTYVETITSASYDPSIEFCIEDAYLPDDDGEGSLREAVACSMPGDTIRISQILSGDTIKLTSGPIIIDKDVVIIADKADMVFISGSAQNRIFEIKPGTMVSLEGLKIVCGMGATARCIKNEGNLTLKDMLFENSGDPITMGTMIENMGTLTIKGETNIKK